MAASNPAGEMQFWFNGLPFGGVKLGTNDMGEMQFWFNGLPGGFLFPTAAPPPPTTRLKDIISHGVIPWAR